MARVGRGRARPLISPRLRGSVSTGPGLTLTGQGLEGGGGCCLKGWRLGGVGGEGWGLGLVPGLVLWLGRDSRTCRTRRSGRRALLDRGQRAGDAAGPVWASRGRG